MSRLAQIVMLHQILSTAVSVAYKCSGELRREPPTYLTSIARFGNIYPQVCLLLLLYLKNIK